jgi:protein-S-isoprenylcysteine O-methyltransferase Ste14
MKRIIGIIFSSTLAVAAFFAAAGTAIWWNGWTFLVFIMVIGTFTARLFKDSPGLAEERRTAAEKAAPWDRVLVRLINLALPVMLLVSAFEKRFHWFPAMPPGLSVAAFAAMVPAAMLTYRAIAANQFFSSHVRIQKDRGQTVITRGPYSVVRHPGYAGSAAFNLLVPVALGSWAALLPALGTVGLLAYRTAREDRVLQAELPGYPAYRKQVRSRLIPMVW